MTRSYQIAEIRGTPDWTQVAQAPVDQLLWTKETDIRAYAQLCRGEDRLLVHLHADEPHIRAEGQDVLDQPCLDSCLEFFLSPVEGDPRYLNIEMNPNRCLYLGLGTGREDLVRILPQSGAEALHARVERTGNAWDLYYALPFSLIRLFFPAFAPVGRMRGNFYKCGDLTEQEHYLSWNRVGCAEPDFHRPEYFGTLCF